MLEEKGVPRGGHARTPKAIRWKKESKKRGFTTQRLESRFSTGIGEPRLGAEESITTSRQNRRKSLSRPRDGITKTRIVAP